MSNSIGLDRAIARLGMVNWQLQLLKVLLVVVTAVGWSYFMWDMGKDYERKKYNEQTITAVVERVNERMPVVARAERDAAKLRQELSTIKEKLDEEAAAEPIAGCELTDVELSMYKELAEKTRR